MLCYCIDNYEEFKNAISLDLNALVYEILMKNIHTNDLLNDDNSLNQHSLVWQFACTILCLCDNSLVQ